MVDWLWRTSSFVNLRRLRSKRLGNRWNLKVASPSKWCLNERLYCRHALLSMRKNMGRIDQRRSSWVYSWWCLLCSRARVLRLRHQNQSWRNKIRSCHRRGSFSLGKRAMKDQEKEEEVWRWWRGRWIGRRRRGRAWCWWQSNPEA